jgi:hypothetical protein
MSTSVVVTVTATGATTITATGEADTTDFVMSQRDELNTASVSSSVFVTVTTTD